MERSSKEMSMKRKKKNGRKQNKVEHFGTSSFHCKLCAINFEVSWLDIFSIQDVTHGFVGFQLQDEYISCPKCGGNANEDSADEQQLYINNQDFISDDNLPF
ncbi:hypothetical protein [Metabacillus elymi]|uniref:Uncharacterized protein n=1 Tax=Metabacillus elymi TaxID=2745198 RepID=A0ABX6S872_9BACI|nr:hypothetical protein [Metabacillus sp. KUDC1714]QNF29958.1 hypothetical protein HUW50_22190 [Metabacillus sp. KUDC1714]